jgi:hypothetical protein
MYGVTFNRTGQTLWMRECRTDAERMRLEEFFFGAIARVAGLDRQRAELTLLDVGTIESADYTFLMSNMTRFRFCTRDGRAFKVFRPLNPGVAVGIALKQMEPAAGRDQEWSQIGWLSQSGLMVLDAGGQRIDVLREGDMIITGELDFLEV